MTEKPKIKFAKNTDLQKAIRIGFDESFTALRESFADLLDDQAWAFPAAGRANIAWIVMHSLLNLDLHGTHSLYYLLYDGDGEHNKYAVDWDRYGDQFYMDQQPQLGDSFPTVGRMLDYLEAVQRTTFEILDRLTEADLRKPIRDWWQSASDACMRTIWHTMAHVRQIWLLRGLLGWNQEQAWPCQHWA